MAGLSFHRNSERKGGMKKKERKGKFEATWESLRNYECPDWFRNAKFGIWSHWGPQSVPMYGDWYARYMYVQGHPQYLYHVRRYGHPSKFGYKDICALWKAERFDPEALMSLYKKAGARYFMAQAVHHDNFFNYPSKLNRFNSMQVGPGKDICGLWKAAAEREGLPFGLSEHLGASFMWWRTNKWCDAYGPYKGIPYDGNDPEYRDFYFDNYEHVREGEDRINTWSQLGYTKNKKFRKYWLAAATELIDLYAPDLLYSDGSVPFGEGGVTPAGSRDFNAGLKAVAHLYNTSIEKHGFNRAVYNQKDLRPEIYRIGVLDIERSQLPGIHPDPWQTDTCIGSWFYDVRQIFKQPGHIIEMLADIVSKNGCMLLNILQKPDGTIDDETLYLLQELAAWFKLCGEAVHETQPWRCFGEGDSRVLIEGCREDTVEWKSSDFRFTTRGNTLYAFMLRAPDDRVAVIRSLDEQERVGSVRLLGAGDCRFKQSFGTLLVHLPEKLPTKYTNVLRIRIG